VPTPSLFIDFSFFDDHLKYYDMFAAIAVSLFG